MHAIRDGGIIAIQGDRVTPGISDLPAVLFGKSTRVPAGPFALAMSTGAPIHPVFVVRRGRRLYRLVSRAPISVAAARNRDEAFSAAVAQWTRELEDVIRSWWYQWFMFEDFAS